MVIFSFAQAPVSKKDMFFAISFCDSLADSLADSRIVNYKIKHVIIKSRIDDGVIYEHPRYETENMSFKCKAKKVVDIDTLDLNLIKERVHFFQSIYDMSYMDVFDSLANIKLSDSLLPHDVVFSIETHYFLILKTYIGKALNDQLLILSAFP